DRLLLRPVLRQRSARAERHQKRFQKPDHRRVNATIVARVNILFASEIEKAEHWLPLLERALPRDRILLRPDAPIDVALVATPPPGTLENLRGVKLIQSLWMGVEKLLADPALPKGVPLARLVDPGMVAAMSETVLAHVLDWHRQHYAYRAQQHERRWHRHRQYLAADRTVGLLGLGELGSDAAGKLLAHAYLDEFEPEPLPADNALWRHPKVTLTPHAAALTDARTAVPRIVENIERLRSGRPLLNVVDVERGY